MAKHYNWYQWHSLVDSIYCFLVTKLSAGQFFRKGWGDKDTFNKQQRLFLEKLKQCKEARNLGEPLKGLSVTNLKWTYESNCLEFSSAGMDKKQFWLWNRVAEVWKLHLREGCFPSPAIEWLNETESLVVKFSPRNKDGTISSLGAYTELWFHCGNTPCRYRRPRL